METPTPSVEFSAECITESNGVRVQEKLYYVPGKLRRDLQVGQGLQIEIYRWDQNRALLMMTADKLYLERPISPNDHPVPGTAGLDLTPDGEEAVNHIPTTKYRARSRPDAPTFVTGNLWVTKEGITVKADLHLKAPSGPSFTLELQNLKVGTLDSSLFEIPSGYHRLSVGPAPSPPLKQESKPPAP